MKKRLILWCCLVLLFLGAVLPALASSNDIVGYVYTSNGKELAMHKSPSSGSRDVAQLPYGAKVHIKQLVNNDQWAYCGYHGTFGYVQTRYLVSSPPAPYHASSSSSSKSNSSQQEDLKSAFSGFRAQNYDVRVRSSTPGGYVNLRWGPSKQIAVQMRIDDGSTLHVLAHNSHWAQVQDPDTGAVGFMMRSFLSALN